MVESEFGFAVADEVVSKTSSHSEGVYSGVESYPHQDLIAMIGGLSVSVGLEQGELVRSFGRYLFRSFTKNNTMFFEGISDAFVFLKGIETVIHTEVRKLYDDAKPPEFECYEDGDRALVLNYRSNRPFADLAEGLILECLEYFEDNAVLSRFAGPTGDHCSARFVLERSKTVP